MEPSKIRQYLFPALAVAAFIIVFALILMPKNDNPYSGVSKKETSGAPSTLYPEGTDTSDSGITYSPPALDALEWQPLPGGVKIWDVKVGEGEPVTAGKTVAAHYVGWRANDGYNFDKSRKYGTLPTDFSLNRVVEGWKQGIPGMKRGGIRRIFIPSHLGYGPKGNGPDIPPNTDLLFEVKLIGF
jgi:FKBP-type peptidyl-prolyl cis-trans isomerase